MAKSDNKDEPKTVSVASRVHTSIRVLEPPDDPGKPGLRPEGRSLVLHGASHPLARNGEMINHAVDAEIFRRWHEHQKAVHAPVADLVYEVPPDDHDVAGAPVHGLEPASPELASPELAATSDTPNDATPSSDTDVPPTKR